MLCAQIFVNILCPAKNLTRFVYLQWNCEIMSFLWLLARWHFFILRFSTLNSLIKPLNFGFLFLFSVIQLWECPTFSEVQVKVCFAFLLRFEFLFYRSEEFLRIEIQRLCQSSSILFNCVCVLYDTLMCCLSSTSTLSPSSWEFVELWSKSSFCSFSLVVVCFSLVWVCL